MRPMALHDTSRLRVAIAVPERGGHDIPTLGAGGDHRHRRHRGVDSPAVPLGPRPDHPWLPRRSGWGQHLHVTGARNAFRRNAFRRTSAIATMAQKARGIRGNGAGVNTTTATTTASTMSGTGTKPNAIGTGPKRPNRLRVRFGE